MKTRLKEIHVLVLYVLAIVGIFLVVLPDLQVFWPRLLLALCWLLSFTVRNLFLYKTEKYKGYAWITYVAELGILFALGLSGSGASTRLLFCVSVADCYIVWSAAISTAYMVVAFLLVFSFSIIGMAADAKIILAACAGEAPIFLFTALIAYMFGRVLKSNAVIERSMQSLQLREADLKAAYAELDSAYQTLEEMTALRERNRIAREIHDTVGHTMTTVIVELEAGLAQYEKNPEISLERFRMAEEQASKGLNELRESVRLLAEERGDTGFAQSLLDILEETQTHAGIAVKHNIDIPGDFLSAHAGIVRRALKEGLANGIRHGKATAFYFELLAADGLLNFLLEDNGAGCAALKPGFGLTNMQNSVEDAGGSFAFHFEPGEGFELKISLPLGEARRD